MPSMKLSVSAPALAALSAGARDQVQVTGSSAVLPYATKLRVAPMDGIVPSFEPMSSGDCPLSQPLYFNQQKAQISVIPGRKKYTGSSRPITRPDWVAHLPPEVGCLTRNWS